MAGVFKMPWQFSKRISVYYPALEKIFSTPKDYREQLYRLPKILSFILISPLWRRARRKVRAFYSLSRIPAGHDESA
jgi:hypothetical protein